MKKIILSTLLGLGIVSGAFAAGSYVENFESYGSLSYSGDSASMNNGAILYGNNTNAVNIHQEGSAWKALRLAQDGTGSTTATYVIGAVENSSTRANSFTASFDLYLKKNSGNPADRFAFHFGNLTGSGARDGESGLWSTGQSGSMLSLVWDFWNNGSGDFIGSGTNRGVELYKNGSLVSGAQVNNPVPIESNLNGSFTRVNLRYDEELNGGTFIFNTGGTVGAGNLISGGSNFITQNGLGVNFAAGDKFAFSAATGDAHLDVFIDNVSINTVPEPSAGALLMVGIGGLIALRRVRRS